MKIQVNISGHKPHLSPESLYLILKRDEVGSIYFIDFYEVCETLKNKIHAHSNQHIKING